MKLSTPLRSLQEGLLFTMDPHADPSKVPRFSSPLSFFKCGAFLAVLLLISVVGSSHAADNCVCNYNASRDYFPVKLTANFASHYSIEYHNTYKKITSTAYGETVVLYAYLCGTPRPAEATDDNSVQIPINSIGLGSTTYLPLVNYIGKRTSIDFVATDESGLPSCIRKVIQQGNAVADYNISTVASQVLQVARKKTGDTPDIFLLSAYEFAKNSAEVKSALGSRTVSFLLAQDTEPTSLGALEWLEPVAALFNAEVDAQYVVTNIQSRYNCAANLVSDIAPANKVKVLWGSTYEYEGVKYWSMGYCPNFYCDLIRDAGGVMIETGSVNETTIVNFIDQADVFIYTDYNWNVSGPYGSLTQAIGDPDFPERTARILNSAVVRNKKVFDIYGKNYYADYFDDRLAEPDVMLMDLIQAFYDDQYITVREKVFLRNVYTEPVSASSTTPRDPALCTNVDAPLYTGWLEGPCFQSGQADTDPVAPLCLQGSSGIVSTGSLSLFIVAAFIALLLATM